MTPERWHQLKNLYAQAEGLDGREREALLAAADPDLADLFRRLLAAGKSKGFLDRPLPPIDDTAPLSLSTHAFSPGDRLCDRFNIVRFIARGGMGEVYEAMDQELQQSVALKTIRPAIASSADVIERFKREVKESRRITHSSVCRVYDLFSWEQPAGDPLWFLTMELLEGQPLQDALSARGPMTITQAIPLIGDMVAALSAAHAIDIVHRDFKPGNIMLVKRGSERERAVVTDFGLAVDLSRHASGNSIAPDGTPAYMSPEQVNGGKIGFEADQYALGLVICEILTGRRPLLECSSAEESRRQLNQWLNRQSREGLPRRARTVIRRCLEFRPEHRYPHVRDVVPVLAGSSYSARLLRAAAITIGCVLTLVLAMSTVESAPQVQDAVQMTPESGLSATPGISRDGKWFVYSSNRSQAGNLDIWIQPAAGGLLRRLTTDPAVDTDPVISPDGKVVAFRSERNGGGLYVVGSDGSGERLLVAGGWTPAFSPDGRQIAYWLGTRDDASPSAQLYLIDAQGGQPRRLAADFADARYPTWNSTGQFLLFDGCKTNITALSTCTDWWVIRPDGTDARNTGALAFIKSQKIELPSAQKAWWKNEIIFSGWRGSIVPLWALRLSRDTMRPVGVPRRITFGEVGEREPAASANGTIVFGRATAALHIWRISLKRGAGAATQVTDDPELDGCPSVSQDGHWLYFTRKIHGVRQLLVRDLVANRESVVFASDENKFWPISSPSGERAAVEVRREMDSSIWQVERNGQSHRLCSRCSHPTSWFDSGRALFYTTAAGQIALLDVATGTSHIVMSPEKDSVLGGADWNPTNQHLLFTSGRQGSSKQVFGVRFPATAGGPSGPWIQLTHDVAEIDQPHWSADGTAFYFLSKRDSSNCVWGRPFSAVHSTCGPPFAVMHYHDLRSAPDRVSPLTRGLTVSADSIYLNVGEVTDTLWLGKLVEPTLLSAFRKLAFGR